jgi:ElaB/YqjD/DUF883 family membrane-anchored ribosome-binding protein
MSDNLVLTEKIMGAVQCLNTAEEILKCEGVFDNLEQLSGWSPHHYAKREQSRAEKAEAEVERLRESLERYDDIINKQDDEIIRLREVYSNLLNKWGAKAEAEVDRLNAQLTTVIEIAEWYMDNIVSSPPKDVLEAIKLTLNPTDK